LASNESEIVIITGNINLRMNTSELLRQVQGEESADYEKK